MASFSDYIVRAYSNFNVTDINNTTINCRAENTIEDGSINYVSLIVDTSSKQFEVPCFQIGTFVENVVHQHIINGTPCYANAVSVPLFYNERNYYRGVQEFKSANPILKRFLYETHEFDGLTKVKCNEVFYYGSKGLIMYEDFTPMIMFTLEIEKVGDKVMPKRQVLHISPKVYQQEDLLSKNIRTKFLCNLSALNTEYFIADYYRHLETYGGYTDHSIVLPNTLDYKFKVVIDDFSNFFSYPSVPNSSSTSENLNQFIVNHLTEIVESL